MTVVVALRLHAPDLGGEGLCSRYDPDEWFPKSPDDPCTFAKSVCARCPVAQRCLAWALDNDERHGCWGGATAWERAAIRRKRGAA